MNYLKILVFVLFLPFSVFAQDQTEEEILESLLHEFLQGSSENDVNAHIRFWSDDLIYTSSAAERIGKEDILSSFEDGVEQPDSLLPEYFGDQIEIRIYGDTAIVAFRLNAIILLETGGSDHFKYYNTGTFVKELGEWKVVAWHVTRIAD